MATTTTAVCKFCSQPVSATNGWNLDGVCQDCQNEVAEIATPEELMFLEMMSLIRAEAK